ncbi:hypothetical protein ACRXB1_37690, partial [Caballeronia sp. M23-90]
MKYTLKWLESPIPLVTGTVNPTRKGTTIVGAGSGEIVSLNIDAVNMKYTLKWLESPIPLVTGTVNPTRKGTTIV